MAEVLTGPRMVKELIDLLEAFVPEHARLDSAGIVVALLSGLASAKPLPLTPADKLTEQLGIVVSAGELIPSFHTTALVAVKTVADLVGKPSEEPLLMVVMRSQETGKVH